MFLGTGFIREMPALVRQLGESLGLQEVRATRRYRLIVPQRSDAACYLQGVNDATHGIGDPLLSVVAVRAGDIVADILDHRAGTAGATGGYTAASLPGPQALNRAPV